MRILLVEDEPDLGAAIKRTLNQDAYIVDWTLDGAAAWSFLDSQRLQYTLGVFDWLLPGLSGLELCKRLRSRQNPLPVLMLTAKDRMEDKVEGLDAGADDYLVKPFGMAEFLARVRALQRRSPQLQPQQLRAGKLVLHYDTHEVFSEDAIDPQASIPLTHKEFQLLEYFMRHPNQILTREQILDCLWELGVEPMSNVVAAQVRLLRRKLAQYGFTNLIETVYGIGYRLNLSEE